MIKIEAVYSEDESIKTIYVVKSNENVYVLNEECKIIGYHINHEHELSLIN